jgi:hypothetical protein
MTEQATTFVSEVEDLPNNDGVRPSDVKGSRAWCSKIRRRAKELVRVIDLGYFDLCNVLYEIYDTPVDGDAKREPVFALWNYSSFGEYAQVELGLKPRKAEYLRSIGFKFATDLAELDPKLKEELVALGWTKLRELVKVLTIRNAAGWIERGKKLSQAELLDLVKKHLEDRAARREEREMAELINAGGGAPADADDENLPSEEKPSWEHFMFYGDQVEPVREALTRAAELSQSDKKSHNLALICTDFLATNSFGHSNDPAMVKRWLAKVETLLPGLRLVAVTTDSNLVYVGADALEHLSEALAKEEANGDPTSES